MTASDSDLTSQFVDGNSDALAELVHRYVDLVFSAAKRQVNGDAHAAEDVVQIVFAGFLKKAALLRYRGSLAGWFYTTTHYVSANFVRSERRRKQREMEAHVMENIISQATAEADWSQLKPVLDLAMHELKERDREAILMRYFEHLSLAQIGERLGVTENTAAKRLERALGLLRGRFAKRGLSSASAALALMLGEQAVLAAPSSLASAITSSVAAGVTLSSASIAVTVLNIMNASKVVGGIATVIAATAIGIAVHQTSMLRDTNAAFASLRNERDQTSTPRLAAAISTSPREPTPEASHSTREQQMAAHDSIPREVNAKSGPGQMPPQKSNLRKKYEPLIKQLGRRAEQAEVLLNLLVNRLNIGADVTGAARDLGLGITADPKLFTAAVAREKAEIDDQIAALLGVDGYADYQAFDKDQRSFVTSTNVQKLFVSKSVPLTISQTSALQNDLTAKGTLEFGVRQVTEEVIANAESYLSAPQLSALRQFKMQQQEVVRAKVMLRDNPKN